MTFEESLKIFFYNYSKFLEVDLAVSLLDKKNKYFGRNITILLMFQETLVFIIKMKSVNQEDLESYKDMVKKLILDLEELTLQYIKETPGEIGRIDSEAIKHTIDSNLYYINKLSDNQFMNSVSDYYMSYKDFLSHVAAIKIDEEIKSKFELNSNEDIVLVQSILEFNNALSHILVALINQDCDHLNNIGKAINHLYRGTLDHYKMLIRLMFMDKRNKAIHPQILVEFKDLRFKEFKLLGTDINSKTISSHNSETNILHCYKEMFTKIMMNIPN